MSGTLARLSCVRQSHCPVCRGADGAEASPICKGSARSHRKRGGYSTYSAFSADIFGHRPRCRPPSGAFLALRSIFFPHESAGRGAYLSFLSQSAFFFRKALRSRKRNEETQESSKTTDRGCSPTLQDSGFSASCAAAPHWATTDERFSP
jgi:hypothetical protein